MKLCSTPHLHSHFAMSTNAIRQLKNFWKWSQGANHSWVKYPSGFLPESAFLLTEKISFFNFCRLHSTRFLQKAKRPLLSLSKFYEILHSQVLCENVVCPQFLISLFKEIAI